MLNYPVQISEENLTSDDVQRLLSKPSLLARRMDSILNKAFVSDLLLTGSADVTGSGAALVEEDTPIYPARDAEQVSPLAEYPKTPIATGPAQTVDAVRRGQETDISDSAIAHQPSSILDKALMVLANGLIKTIDSLSLSAIASKVTATHPASATWTAGQQIVQDVLLAKAEIDEKELGYSPNVVVLKPTQYAAVSSALIGSNLLPREDQNPLLSGAGTFEYLGLVWTQTVHMPGTGDPLLVDSTQLGGMLTENLGGGYAAYGQRGIEVKSIRDDDNDAWTVRVRRVSAPYILAPQAGVFITGTK